MTTDLLPTAEVARLCGVSVATVNRWADAERITPVAQAPGLRGARMFDRRDVALLLSQIDAERRPA